jgi:hypothetical protein
MGDVYVDNTKESGTLTGANWQFTNGSTTVTETGAAGNALAELSAGDYARTNGGVEWYKVASVTNDDEFEININFQQGNNTDTCKYNNENGSATGQAFAHPNAATTDTVRTAGDDITLRANQTHVLAGININFDEDGTATNHITMKGADSVDDPWSDGSDVKPILDFGDTAFGLFFNNDNSWSFERVAFVKSTKAQGPVYQTTTYGCIFTDCEFYNNDAGGSGYGGTFSRASVEFDGCTFYDNKTANLNLSQSRVILRDCTFNGGAAGTAYGYILGYATSVEMQNVTFGSTTEHSTADIAQGFMAEIVGRNVILDSTTQVTTEDTNGRELSYIRLEDNGQVHNAYKAWYYTGTVTRSVAVERSGSGGTNWSLLGEPNSNCGTTHDLYIVGDWVRGFPIYLDGTEQTITVYAYADSTGGGWTPNASEFHIEIEHYQGAADWAIDVSSDTFAAEDQWESFEVTLTPNAAGFAYLRVIVNDNVAGAKIYVDPVPEIDGSRDESLIAATVDGVRAGYEYVARRRTRGRYHNV